MYVKQLTYSLACNLWIHLKIWCYHLQSNDGSLSDNKPQARNLGTYSRIRGRTEICIQTKVCHFERLLQDDINNCVIKTMTIILTNSETEHFRTHVDLTVFTLYGFLKHTNVYTLTSLESCKYAFKQVPWHWCKKKKKPRSTLLIILKLYFELSLRFTTHTVKRLPNAIIQGVSEITLQTFRGDGEG